MHCMFFGRVPGPDPTLVGSAEDEATQRRAIPHSWSPMTVRRSDPRARARKSTPHPRYDAPESSSVRAVSRIVIWTLLALIALAGAAWALREWSGLPSP